MQGDMNMTILKPFPQLETERLILRKMNSSDKSDIFNMQSNPKMSEHSDSQPETELAGSLAYIKHMETGVSEGKWLIWALEEKETHKVIGTVCIWNFSTDKKTAELGYGIIPEYQGKGLMSEALLSIIDYSFNVFDMNLLDAYTEENNIPSIKMLDRIGFKEFDRVIDEGFYKKRDFCMVVFRLSKD